MVLNQPTKCSREKPLHMELLNINEHPWHMHDNMEIIYVLKGSLECEVSIYPSSLNAGDIAVINTETLHYFKGSSDNISLVCHINPGFFSSVLPEINDTLIICNSGAAIEYDRHYDLLKDALSTVFLHYYGLRPPQHDELMDSCVSFLSVLYNHFNFLQHEGAAIRSENIMKQRPLQAERVRRVMKYMYDNLGSRISLEEFAAREYVSKYYLSHLMSEFLGMPFRDYVSMTRSVYAQDYIYGTDMTLGEISIQCGFSTTELFRKAYTKYTGRSPAEDRRRISGHTIKDIPLNDKDALINISIYDAAALMNVKAHYMAPVNPLENRAYPVTNVPVNFAEMQSSPLCVTWDTVYIDDPRQILSADTIKALEMLNEHGCFSKVLLDPDRLAAFSETFGGWDFCGTFFRKLKELNLSLFLQTAGDIPESLMQYASDVCGISVSARQTAAGTVSFEDTVPAAIASAHFSDTYVYPTLYENDGNAPFLFSRQNLKTAFFYIYSFLNRLQPECLYADNGCIFSCSSQRTVILLYNTDPEDAPIRKYMFQLKHLPRKYLCSIKTVDLAYESEADIYEKLMPGRTPDGELRNLLDIKAAPDIEISSVEALPEYNLFMSSEPGSVTLIELI